MTETATIRYRIPAEPIGLAYYRLGTRYEPGDVVVLPANELPPGWKTVRGEPRPVERHAWQKLGAGASRTSLEAEEEQQLELARARAQRAELAKQLEEQDRVLEELEAASEKEGGPTRGIVVQDEDDGDDQPHPEPKEPDAEDLNATRRSRTKDLEV